MSSTPDGPKSHGITLVRSQSPDRASAGKFDACLVGLAGPDMGRRFLLAKRKVALGRALDADIVVDDPDVSRYHAEILSVPAGVVIMDKGSTNGSFVNGDRVSQQLLKDGDQLQLGACVFKFIRANHVELAYFDEMFRLTNTDSLTSVYNKRYFLSMLEREVSRAARYGRNLSLLMLDLDFFKKVNDTFGHVAGDAVLVEASRRYRAAIRNDDVLARFGGEEFAVLLPETDLETAREVAERICRSLAGTPVIHGETVIPVTISIGAASLDEVPVDGDDPLAQTQRTETFLTLTDMKLYEAKHSGRNRVVA